MAIVTLATKIVATMSHLRTQRSSFAGCERRSALRRRVRMRYAGTDTMRNAIAVRTAPE